VIVGLSTTDHVTSKIIRAVTHADVSHAWLRFPLYGRELVLQADHRGVNLEDFGRFRSHNRVVRQYSLVNPIEDSLMHELLERLGASYDYRGLVGNGWVLLGQAFHRHWENPFQGEDEWYCSELVADYIMRTGQKLPAPAAAISPVALDKILAGSPFAAVIV